MKLRLESPLPLFAGLLLALHLPFLSQAFHIDDANFLALADGVLADPWRPHDVILNWLGAPERAFDVLSNPPGVAYLLAAVKLVGGGEALSHLALLPFTALAAWGMWRLASRFCADPLLPALIFAVSPAVVVSAHLVMPDLPLLGLYLSGLALAIEGVDEGDGRRGALGAVVLGGASLFRYSGLTGGPLLALYLFAQRRRSPLSGRALVGVGLCALLIPLLWAAHDVHAYGRWHFWHMIAFQGGEEGIGFTRKLLAQILFTGGVAALPLLPLASRPRSGPAGRIPWGLLALCLPPLAALVSRADAAGQVEWILGAAFALTALWLWATALSAAPLRGLGQAARGRGGAGADAAFLAAWALGMLVFNQGLRFVAARYLLLGLAPLTLLAFGGVAPFGPRLRWGMVGGAALLSLTLSAADYAAADVYRAFARDHIQGPGAPSPGGGPSGPALRFAGHWGFQRYLEARGAEAITEGIPPPAGGWIASATFPWPQEIALGGAAPVEERIFTYDSLIPLRTLSTSPPACFHANAVASAPMADAARALETSRVAPVRLADPSPLLREAVWEEGDRGHAPAPPEGQAAWLPWTLSLDPHAEVITLLRIGEAP